MKKKYLIELLFIYYCAYSSVLLISLNNICYIFNNNLIILDFNKKIEENFSQFVLNTFFYDRKLK